MSVLTRGTKLIVIEKIIEAETYCNGRHINENDILIVSKEEYKAYTGDLIIDFYMPDYTSCSWTTKDLLRHVKIIDETNEQRKQNIKDAEEGYNKFKENWYKGYDKWLVKNEKDKAANSALNRIPRIVADIKKAKAEANPFYRSSIEERNNNEAQQQLLRNIAGTTAYNKGKNGPVTNTATLADAYGAVGGRRRTRRRKSKRSKKRRLTRVKR